MKMRMQRGTDPSSIYHGRWDSVYHGPVLDDRGKAAVDFIAANADSLHAALYDPDSLTVEVNHTTRDVDDLKDVVVTSGRVLLESTTLGFAEILLLCRALGGVGLRQIEFLYLEPQQYRNPRRREVLHRRDFELSDMVPGYRSIPGSAVLLRENIQQRGIFFLGFEEVRADRAFEDFPMIDAASSEVVFGVPAFQAGWEMDSLANNIPVLREKGVRGGVHFCAADNPLGAYNILAESRAGLPSGAKLFAAPIGTKPHGIGTAIFACEEPELGILYDHPSRSAGRSSNIEKWHLFQCTFE